MNASVLETLGLFKSFDGVVAVDDVSVNVREGEFLGIIGANGAGKTTFVNIVTGYVKPDRGKVIFDGTDITPLTPRQITRLGVARSFQVPQLFGELSVLDNVLVALAIARGEEREFMRPLRRPHWIEQAYELLSHFRLQEYAESKVATLPQGVRKLLDIAMALGGRPKLVLLDEPTSGVSKDEKFVLMETLLPPLRQIGACVLFVEHDMEIVERYANRVVAFHEGSVLADGDPKTVLEDERVRAFITGGSASSAVRGGSSRDARA